MRDASTNSSTMGVKGNFDFPEKLPITEMTLGLLKKNNKLEVKATFKTMSKD